uniref:rho GTPase-activating protein 45-like isoform X2 n=1 Tax=Myxine glutinosa TaxID=7769 RepID=UPI00358EF819
MESSTAKPPQPSAQDSLDLSAAKKQQVEVTDLLQYMTNHHPALDTEDTRQCIQSLQQHLDDYNTGPDWQSEADMAIECLAMSLSSSVSEVLMGNGDGESSSASEILEEFPQSEHGKNEEQTQSLGVEEAMRYARSLSRFMKDLSNWVEKRMTLDLDHAKVLAKLAAASKPSFLQETHMPLQSVFSLAAEQDCEHAQQAAKFTNNLNTQVLQPLSLRRMEHDRRRKEIKETWQRAHRKLVDAEATLRKASMGYQAKGRDWEQARAGTARAQEEPGGGGANQGINRQLERKKKQEAEAEQRAVEAREICQRCEQECEDRKAMLESTRQNALSQLQDVITESDQIIRKVTVDYFDVQRKLLVTRPACARTLSESGRLHEPGRQFAAWSRLHIPQYLGTNVQSCERHNSEEAGRAELPEEFVEERNHRASISDVPGLASRSLAALTHRMRPLRGPARCRECDSFVYLQGAECQDCFLACHRRCLQTLALRCGGHPVGGRLQLFGRPLLPGPPRPSGSPVHLASPGATNSSLPGSPMPPFLICVCVAEIESRALNLKGIYRLSGSKARVERLCQSFESGAQSVELSQASPHDVCNVLKLFLRQLPEPIFTFDLYQDFIKLAKDSMKEQSGNGPENEGSKAFAGAERSREPAVVEDKVIEGSEVTKLETKDVSTVTESDNDEVPGLIEADSVEESKIITRLRSLVSQLPPLNRKTLHFFAAHLYRVQERSAENGMDAENLGVVLGPTLLRPARPGTSLSSLSDCPLQSRLVTLLIQHHQEVFENGELEENKKRPSDEDDCVDEKGLIEDAIEAEEENKKSIETDEENDDQVCDVCSEGSTAETSSHVELSTNDLVEDTRSDALSVGSQQSVASTEDGGKEEEELGTLKSMSRAPHHSTLSLVQMRNSRHPTAFRPISLPPGLELGCEVTRSSSQPPVARRIPPRSFHRAAVTTRTAQIVVAAINPGTMKRGRQEATGVTRNSEMNQKAITKNDNNIA